MILWGRLPHLRVSNGAYLVQKSASPEAGATLFLGGGVPALVGAAQESGRGLAWVRGLLLCCSRSPDTLILPGTGSTFPLESSADKFRFTAKPSCPNRTFWIFC